LFLLASATFIYEEFIQEEVILTDVIVYKNIEKISGVKTSKHVFVMNMYTYQPGFYFDNQHLAYDMLNLVQTRQTALVTALPNAFGDPTKRSRILSLTQNGRELIREDNFSQWLTVLIPMGSVIMLGGIVEMFKRRRKYVSTTH
jgi:hypothetical protein